MEIVVLDDQDEVEYVNRANSIHFNNNIEGEGEEEEEKYYYAKRSKRDNVIGAWQPCELLQKNNHLSDDCDFMYIVRFIKDGIRKDVAEYELAFRKIPHSLELQIGTRIIARRRTEDLPYRIDAFNQKIQLFASTEKEFYPGIIGGFYNPQFMIFFDDGIVQKVDITHIRKVQKGFEAKFAHRNAKMYFEWLLKYAERLEVKDPKEGQTFKIELNGINEEAKVMQVDTPLIHVHFEAYNRFEWIYLGSPRIVGIYRKLIKQKKLDDLIEFKRYKACLSADDEILMCDDVIIIDPYDDEDELKVQTFDLTSIVENVESVRHECGPNCVSTEENVNLQNYSVYQRPFIVGWERYGQNKKYYRTPCRKSYGSIESVDKFLLKTNSKLRIDSFEFSKICDIRKETFTTSITKFEDISRGIEKLAITVCDEFSLKDRSFKYINNYQFDYCDSELKDNLGRTGCNCKDNCRDKLRCSCWRLTIANFLKRTPTELDYKNNIQIAYKNMKLMDIVHSGIVECGEKCKCCIEKCVNRVVQNGLQHKLELFKTKNRGWGVRTKYDIPKAVFVCSYSGDILENSSADKRDTKYQFKIPIFHEADYSDSEDDNDEPIPKRLRNRHSDDVIQPFLNYFPLSMKNGNAKNFPESEYKTSTDKGYVVDALCHGNISRFINHSCDPNLFVQAVHLYDDRRFPHIAFFSIGLIKAGEELTIDYRYDLIDEIKTPCLCGSANCRKRLI